MRDDIDLPPVAEVALMDWVASQPLEVSLPFIQVWSRLKNFPAPLSPDPLPRARQKDAQILRIVAACKSYWPGVSANAMAKKMKEAADAYEAGAFKRNVQMNRIPPADPQRTIHLVLVENKDQPSKFPSARTIRRRIDL